MKRFFICLLATFAIATSAAAAATTEITASGAGSVSLPPNQATVTAAVETNAATADQALGQNNTIYERIVAELSKLGIARTRRHALLLQRQLQCAAEGGRCLRVGALRLQRIAQLCRRRSQHRQDRQRQRRLPCRRRDLHQRRQLRPFEYRHGARPGDE